MIKKLIIPFVILLFLLTSTGIPAAANRVSNTYFNELQYTSFIEGFVRYDNIWMSPVANATVSLTQNNATILQTTTDALGYFIFQDVPPGTYVIKTSSQLPIGGVNATDAFLILQAFVGGISFSPLQKWAADVNNSGGPANAVDALAVLHFFTGSISHFLIPNWYFESPVATVDGNNNAAVLIMGICAGDVNRSNIP